MTKLEKLCIGKTLPEIWQSEAVRQEIRTLRAKFQEIVNQWAARDDKRHIPVYISLKPKVTLNGLYFEKKRGNGAITLFPIRAFPYKPVHNVASERELEDTLRHEYAHHLTGTGHGNKFQQNLERVKARK